MEKKTISAGIIGAGGFIGQEHLKRLTKRIDGVAVTALYDINKEKTDARAAAYGAESMESVDALIASDKVDAIVITAWDGVHAEMTNKAIAAGKPVFCEKPLATTKADCAEIVRIEQAAGRNLVQVGFMRRHRLDEGAARGIGQHHGQCLEIDLPQNVMHRPSCCGGNLPNDSEGAMGTLVNGS